MPGADELKAPADAAEAPRKVAREVAIIDCRIEGELNGLHGKVNRSLQPTATPSPPNRPSPLAPN